MLITFLDFHYVMIVDVMNKVLWTKTVMLPRVNVLAKGTIMLETSVVNVLKIILDSLIAKNVHVMLKDQQIHVMPLELVLAKIRLKVLHVINVLLLIMVSPTAKNANVMLMDLKMAIVMKRENVPVKVKTLQEINVINVQQVLP